MALKNSLSGEGTNPTLFERAGRFKYAAALLGVLALDGCAQVGATPNSSPTAIVGSADPTEAPSASASPEAAKFTGEVNYDDFENWEAKDETARLQACLAFFEKNPPRTEAQWTAESTGMDIVDRYNAMFLVAAKLNADRSDPRNAKVAQSIADCMTSKRDELGSGHTAFVGSLDINDGTIENKYIPVVKPETVTRYSDGSSPERDSEGYTWISRAVQGVGSDLAHDAQVNQFEVNILNQETYFYRLTRVGPATQFTDDDFGDRPPVTVG